MLARMTGWQSVSQFSSAARLKVCKRLLSESVELARFGIPFDGLIEMRGLELLEPSAKLLELISNPQPPGCQSRAELNEMTANSDKLQE